MTGRGHPLIRASDPAAARAQVEAVVRPQVEANESQIRGAVTEAVKAQVLGQVLAGAGMDMDAEAYSQIKAGRITFE